MYACIDICFYKLPLISENKNTKFMKITAKLKQNTQKNQKSQREKKQFFQKNEYNDLYKSVLNKTILTYK